MKWILSIDVDDIPFEVICWVSAALTERFIEVYKVKPEGQIILSPVSQKEKIVKAPDNEANEILKKIVSMFEPSQLWTKEFNELIERAKKVIGE